MREADGKLGQTLPQVTLAWLGALPGRLEYLVGVKGPAIVDQLLRGRERAGRGDIEAIGQDRIAGGISGQRSSEGVTWPRVPGPAGRVAVALAISRGRVHESALRLRIDKPGPQLEVEALRHLLVREMSGPIDQPPPIWRLDINA